MSSRPLFPRPESLALAASLFVLLTATVAKADRMFIWVEEAPGGVTFRLEGSIDLTGFPARTATGPLSQAISPSLGFIANGSNLIESDIYIGVVPGGAARTFGSGGAIDGVERTGNVFGVSQDTILGLDPDYQSQAPIIGTLRFPGESLASLGIDPTPFSYKTTVGSNRIFMFTSPSEYAVRVAKLRKQIRKLERQIRRLKKQGNTRSLQKAKKKLKKVKRRLRMLR